MSTDHGDILDRWRSQLRHPSNQGRRIVSHLLDEAEGVCAVGLLMEVAGIPKTRRLREHSSGKWRRYFQLQDPTTDGTMNYYICPPSWWWIQTTGLPTAEMERAIARNSRGGFESVAALVDEWIAERADVLDG